MLIDVRNLSKEFNVSKKSNFFKKESSVLKAVQNVSFKIEKGEIVAFIGPNGAGKSTTIKMLTGIIQPTSGNILIDGLNPTIDRKELAYKIGCMFGQKSQLYLHLNVIDSYRLIGAIYDMSKEQVDKKIKEIAEMFEISHLLDKTVRKLSLGQRMICEIAASILHDPDIIFLDEPTIGLDIIAKLKIREIIHRLNQEKNITVFLTSHDISDVEALCDRIIIINNGIIVNDSSINHLKELYLNEKQVQICYSHDVEKINFSKYDVIEASKNKIIVKVDSNIQDIGEILTYFLSYGTISDIQIISTPMENIIKKIYQERMVI